MIEGKQVLDTKVIRLKDNQDNSIYEVAGKIIKEGGLVAFPTETVYGLGGDALNPESSRKIYAAKGRPSDNPLIVHVSNWEAIKPIVSFIPKNAELLAEKYWPGPLTMIFKKSDKVPYETTGGLDTVAVRMPSHPVAKAFIEAAGGYVAAPSANVSGRPSPTTSQYVEEDMMGRIDMILDGGQVEIGLESTIVDVTGDIPMILRPGYVTQEMLTELLGKVETDPAIISGDCKEAPKAPGMKYKHYAPKGSLAIITGTEQDVVSHINALAQTGMKKGQKVGVIATDETKGSYTADSIKSVGSRKDEAAIAASLYKILREFDDENIDLIYSESFQGGGMGQAIMNRLLKAAGYHIEEAANKEDK